MKRDFLPERRMMDLANKAECEVFRVTDLEIGVEDDNPGLYIHQGPEFADFVPMGRISIRHQDVSGGKKFPVYYPSRDQIICETSEAQTALFKMLAMEMKRLGFGMDNLSGESAAVFFKGLGGETDHGDFATIEDAVAPTNPRIIERRFSV